MVLFPCEKVASAEPSSLAQSKHLADAKRLYDSPRWLKLVHYKPNSFRAGYKSTVDDTNFFLASDGKISPRAELLATLEAFYSAEAAIIEKACRFQARLKFLNQFSLAKAFDVKQHCSAYLTWRDERAVSEAWLVFPSSYLNSPSSMFGHTLLRLDGENAQAKSKLLAYAVNYAAKVNPQDNGVFYSIKGLFGGYPGYFSMMSYYEKVKEYNRIENRDIWEYQLNLNSDELDWLLKHLWELDQMRFDYFFTTENCSYQLLSLLEVIRPESKVTDKFDKIAIPVDTVREVIRRGWVNTSNYRESKSTEFYRSISMLTHEEKKLVAKIKNHSLSELGEELKGLEKERRAAVLESSYKLLRLDKKAKLNKALALQVLKARSKVGKVEGVDKANDSPSAPENGHLSHRISVGARAERLQNNSNLSDTMHFGFVEFRMVYHGLEDSIEGFSKNSQINFIDSRLLYGSNEIVLDKLDIVNIRSLSASDRFITRRAWQVALGLDRQLVAANRQGVTGKLSAQFGRVYEVLNGINVYALAGAQLESHKVYENDIEYGPRIDLGVFYQGVKSTMELRFNDTYFVDAGQDRAVTELKSSYFFGKNISMSARLSAERYGSGKLLKRADSTLSYFF